MNSNTVDIFCSYAHKDEKFRLELEKHLSVLKNQGVIRFWSDRKISPGSEWEKQIDCHLNSSQIILLLVSPDFLASGYITSIELKRAMERHESEEACVIPVILRPCPWKKAPFGKLQGLPKDGKPVTKWRNRDEAFLNVAIGILSEVEALKNNVPVKIKGPPLVLPDPIPALGIFIDREKVVKEIQGFFHEDVCRLIIIQGFPGIGKTTLAAKLYGLMQLQFKSVLWFKCHPEQRSPDVVFAKFHAFLEENKDKSLLGIWSDMNPDLLDVKINRLIQALAANRYLIIFDEFENWLGEDFQVKNEQVKKVLSDIFCAAHKSKFILVSHKRPVFDPVTAPLPLGFMKEHTILGLSEPYAIQLLRESGSGIEDKELMSQIVRYCDGNPLMLQIFSYQVRNRHCDPNELIAAGANETPFANLLVKATSGLSRESREVLERLSIYRLPLKRRQLKTLGVPFDQAIEPLIDCFLVTNGEFINVPIRVRNFVLATLSESRCLELHKNAAVFYKELHGNRSPQNYETLQLVLEEAYHRFQSGEYENAAKAILSVAVYLVDWGYTEQAEQQVLQAAKNISDNRLLAQCAWILGRIDDLRANYSTALEHFENALKLYTSVKDYGGVARTLFRIGGIHNALLKFDKANSYFLECINVCEERSITENRGGIFLSMGWNRQARSFKTEKVLEFYQSSLEYAEKERDYKTISSALCNMGFLLWDKKKKKVEALKHYKDALEISRFNNLTNEIGAIHSELGYLHNEWGDHNEAEKNCLQAIEIFKALGNNYGLGNAYCNFARIKESTDVIDEAIQYYKLSIKISSEIKNFGCTAYAAFRLGIVYQKQNKITEAKKLFLEADRLCQDYGLKETGKDVKIELNKLKKPVK
jgi:tetratricopeptide (TPR) repeat protein